MKKIFCITPVAICSAITLFGQSAELRSGNKLYKEGKYDGAVAEYDKAVKKSPADITAMYNRSNALARKGDKEAALESYDRLIAEGKDPKIVERALYDKGVLHQQLQQLDQSIDAWKSALRLDPDDQQARENLEKALREKKRQQEEKEKQEKEQKPKDKKEKDKDKEQQPKPQQQQQSRLNQQQVEQLLRALEQKEKEVQKKMQQKTASPNKPEKDW
jgi:tetratricopeptide (TPR) repeat protein